MIAGRRIVPAALVVGVLAGLVGLPPAAAAAVLVSPPGEMVVVTVNAQQRSYDDAKMRALTSGLAQRVPMAPDAILVDEIVRSSLVPMRDQLNALLGSGTYAIVGTTDSVKVKVLLNTKTMKFTGFRTYTDACTTERTYQIVTADELATGHPVAVAGVHFAPSFNPGGSTECKKLNAEEVRRQMAQYSDSGVLGDFNKRVTENYYECNPEESFDVSPAQEWYRAMTEYSTTDNRTYHDTIRVAHYGVDMPTQWSWEDTATSTTCDGKTAYRRSRLDYIFASQEMTPIDAATDQGWTSANDGPVCSPLPGCHYSDHRFLWARLGLSEQAPDTTAPAAPAGLTAAAADRQVALKWTANAAADGVARYTVYRDGAAVGTTTATSYTDTNLTNGSTYSYTISATDGSDNESPQSAPAVATPKPPPTVHVGGLSATRAKVKKGWNATVTVAVHDDAEAASGGATVSYTWSTGATGTCTTSSAGTCAAKSTTLKSTSVTFKVTNIAKSGSSYAATANHVTQITIARP